MTYQPKDAGPPTPGEAFDVDTLIGMVVDVSPVGMLVVDDQGAILFANRKVEQDFGYRPGTLAGQAVETLLPPETRDAHVAWHQGHLARPVERQMGVGRHVWGRRLDGTKLPVDIGLTPVQVEDRTFLLVSVVDITEQRNVEIAARISLDEQLEFETLVAEVSVDFVNLPSDQLDQAISTALSKFVEALDLDRAGVWLREAEGDDFYLAQRWTRNGLPIETADTTSIKAAFPWVWDKLMAGEVVAFSRVSDVPDETTRASIVRIGAIAGAAIGFSLDGRVAGCVSVASDRDEREWPTEVVSRLQMVSRVFANAIARQRADKALHEALSEVKRLGERLSAENTYLRREMQHALGASPVVGQSAPILQALDLVAQVAPTDSSVLLLGETGTGKELFASQVHDLSARRDRLMVRVNCAAIPDTLLESELFGREKGAYTGALTRQTGRFELADRSTIFLDEIGDLPLEVQVKLLRVLEDRLVERLGGSRAVKVDVRIVAATHRNLEEMVAAGRFREDLYYRLNVFPVRVPPLRERPGDIALLVWRFVDEFSKRFGKPVDSVDKESLAELQRHSWPGNVRELRNVVERAMIVARPGAPLVIPIAVAALPSAGPGSTKLVDVETTHMRSVLETCGWRIRGAGGAAERLGLKPSTLETRLAKLGIRRPEKGA